MILEIIHLDLYLTKSSNICPRKIRGTASNRMFTTTTQNATLETTLKLKTNDKVQVENLCVKNAKSAMTKVNKLTVLISQSKSINIAKLNAMFILLIYGNEKIVLRMPIHGNQIHSIALIKSQAYL